MPPPKKRYEHIHVRLAVAILGHRHFWEVATPLFFKQFSNRKPSKDTLRFESKVTSYSSDV